MTPSKQSAEERVEHTPRQFRKKPVVISAVLFDGTIDSIKAVTDFCQEATCHGYMSIVGGKPFTDLINGVPMVRIPTLEGEHWASIGDYIIKGIKGEFYPCKPDVFDATYESVSDQPSCQYCNDTGEFQAWSHTLGNHTEKCTCPETPKSTEREALVSALRAADEWLEGGGKLTTAEIQSVVQNALASVSPKEKAIK